MKFACGLASKTLQEGLGCWELINKNELSRLCAALPGIIIKEPISEQFRFTFGGDQQLFVREYNWAIVYGWYRSNSLSTKLWGEGLH